jgi:ABC-2 type transport system ATP-binding protein
MESIIVVKNLVKIFNSHGRKIVAVDDISFDIMKGEIFGMIGPNGAGKSTTFSMLTTLIKPTSGEITVAGLMLRKKAIKSDH